MQTKSAFHHITFVYLISLFLLLGLPASARQSAHAAFSPAHGAVALVTRSIASADNIIEVAAYSFSSHKVADALIQAHANGVDVRVVLDKIHASHRYSAVAAMRAAGIPVRVNHRYAIMHDKFLVIDHKTVETGSFNFTASAEHRNAENVLVIKNNKQLARKYEQDWQRLWDEGEDYGS